MRFQVKALTLLVVSALAIVMAGCGAGKTEREGGAAKPTVSTPAQVDRSGYPVIAAFGDSLSFGQGVASNRNYPSQLQAELDQQGYKYRVVNAGVSGDTTAAGLARIENVIKQKPQIIILELGANDGLRGQSVPLMKQNLARMIERFQQEKIQVVLAGMKVPPNYGPEYTKSFEKTFGDLAAVYRVPLIPFFLDGAAAKPELNQPDGIHPTADGYVYVVQNVMGALKPLLKK